MFVTCLWYFLFYEKVYNIGFSVIWNIIFFISAMKSYQRISSCLMLLISWKSGSFSKKDKNAKVRYGEYQYVSTATLTMSEFDPAFIAFIRCRILSLGDKGQVRSSTAG